MTLNRRRLQINDMIIIIIIIIIIIQALYETWH